MNGTQAAYDAIVVGAGHNGLVASAYLAKAGLKVAVFERCQHLGGAAGSEQAFPGCRVPTGAFDSGLFRSEIVRELGLERRGLKFLYSPAVVHALGEAGESLTLWRDVSRSQLEVARFSDRDAERYPAYVRWVSRIAGLLKQAAVLLPPGFPDYRVGELLDWLPLALKARGLGGRDLVELMRALPLSVQDFLDEWFETPLLKAALGAAGVAGLTLGPRASGTAFMLFYQAMQGNVPSSERDGRVFRASSCVQGGMGQLSESLAASARAYGAEIYSALGVSRILIEDGRACGALLEDGRELRARIVLSNADPRRTLFDLAGASHLPVRIVREVKDLRFRGSLARVDLVLRAPPAFDSVKGAGKPLEPLTGHILLCPSLERLERAYDDAKYGRISSEPAIDLVIPTLLDPSLAPEGQHILTTNLQYAPYHLKQGDWESHREGLGDLALDVLERYAPGIRDLVLFRRVVTPLDLELKYGLTEGCITHGQMALDQLFVMRPFPGYGQHRMPVEGLYLCGAGAHPGGGVTGIPGRNAARQALRDWR